VHVQPGVSRGHALARHDQWVPVDEVAYPFMERWPVRVSAAAPDPEAYAALLREIEDWFAAALPAWW